MGPLRRTPLIAVIGGLAALAPVTATVPAYAVTTPGQDVRNDYGQSDAEVAVEIARAVDATPAVVAARSKAAAAHRLALARTAAEAKAEGRLPRRGRSTSTARLQRAHCGPIARRTSARWPRAAADAAAKAACARTVAAATASVRATHYRPVDGTYLGPVSQYFIPSVGLEPIQVRIVVYGGHVSDISVPVYVATGDSGDYNAMALPVLMQRAMAAHDTAAVAAVSGASLTSGAFAKSLSSALVSAGFKG